MQPVCYFGSLLLAMASTIAAPALRQNPSVGTVPQALADGPFVHLMAAHHEEAIKIATAAQTKATSDKVKALAARIFGNRQKELGELRHFMTTVAEDMAPAAKSRLKTMSFERLDTASGAGFDRMFLDTMIEHHQDALTMTRTARLVMPGVQQFAARLTQALTAEVRDAETLRKEWR
jgi:uncharacterized protein (DUF305 family)